MELETCRLRHLVHRAITVSLQKNAYRTPSSSGTTPPSSDKAKGSPSVSACGPVFRTILFLKKYNIVNQINNYQKRVVLGHLAPFFV